MSRRKHLPTTSGASSRSRFKRSSRLHLSSKFRPRRCWVPFERGTRHQGEFHMAQLMRTSNPALSGDTFRTGEATYGEGMTISGAVNKTGILLICCVATAAWTWNRFFGATSPEDAMQAIGPMMVVGGIGGFIVAMVTIFKKEWSPITAPIYALLEGLLLGGVSAMLEMRFHGIAIPAVALTFGTLVAMLVPYRTGLIKVTDKLRLGIVAATGGIAVFYFLQFILGFFGVHFPTIKVSSPMGIGFTLLAVVVAGP